MILFRGDISSQTKVNAKVYNIAKYRCQEMNEGYELRKRITIRSVDDETVDMLRTLREDEGRFMGHIVSDAIRDYWDERYQEEEDTGPVYE
ncbi:MAG: hypothetical protein ABJO57_13040 [Lentilitoribacter sp.]